MKSNKSTAPATPPTPVIQTHMTLVTDPAINDTEDDPVENGRWWNIWMVRCENALSSDTYLTPEAICARMNLSADDWEIEPFLEKMVEMGHAIAGTASRYMGKAVDTPQMKDLRNQIETRNKEIADLKAEAKSSRVSGPVKIIVNVMGSKTKSHQKLTHYQFKDALKYVSARSDQGYPVPTWFWGAAGGGKSHMFRQLAQSLGIDDYMIRGLGPTDTLGSIVGYKNHLTGDFVPGLITPEIYGKGGFVAFDEVCNADPSVPIGLNDLIAGVDFRFANGKLVKKSKDFYLAAGDNTNGGGSKNGFIRNKLDISGLTRFVFFQLEYDDALEVALSGNAKWTAYVQKVRTFCLENTPTSPVYVTPRASINGAALLRAGIDPKQVAKSTLFTHCSADVVDTILTNVGHYQS